MANDKIVPDKTLKDAKSIASKLKRKYPNDTEIVEMVDILDSEMLKRNGSNQKKNKAQ